MGKKLESSFTNMVIVLFTVTLISSAAVAYVNTLTAGPINEAKIANQVQAINDVIPGFNNNPMEEVQRIALSEGDSLDCFPAKKDGQLIGTAIKTNTKNGFSGEISLMIGFNLDGTINNYSVLEHKETPGLGSKMNIWFTKDGKGNIIGKQPMTTGLKVTKDGGDVDAITAATISSRAFLDAVNRAAQALAKLNINTSIEVSTDSTTVNQ